MTGKCDEMILPPFGQCVACKSIYAIHRNPNIPDIHTRLEFPGVPMDLCAGECDVQSYVPLETLLAVAGETEMKEEGEDNDD